MIDFILLGLLWCSLPIMSYVPTEAEVLTQPTLTKALLLVFPARDPHLALLLCTFAHMMLDLHTAHFTPVLFVSIISICDTAQWALAQSLARSVSGISGNA